MAAGSAAKKAPRGRPFQKGVDPRRNVGGGRPHVLTAAVMDAVTPAKAKAVAAKVLALAEAGDLQAIGMLWDRLEGKAVARSENGQPGDFDLDMSDDEREQLRSALKVIRGRRDA